MARKIRKLTPLERIFILAALVMVGFLQFGIVNSPVIRANPDTATYYFNAYGTDVWEVSPGSMVDGSEATFASTIINVDSQLNNSNTCDGADSGAISKVELRAHGYMEGDDYINLEPLFGGTANGDLHAWTDMPVGTDPIVADWSPYFDITADTNAPATWTWTDVQTLDVYVNYIKLAGATRTYISIVEIQVTYIPPKSVSQGITISDAVTVAFGKARSVSQDITISDAVATTSERGKNISQDISITATTSTAVSLSRSVSQDITISDAVTAAFGKARSVSQDVTISDAVATTSERGQNISQDITITAATSTAASFSRSVSQDITISDGVTTASGEGRSVSQDITISDAVATAAERGRNINQGITITATTFIEVSCCKSVSQGITISDAVTAVVGKERSVSQGITMSDAVTADTGDRRSVSQSITMSDGVTTDATIAPPTGGGFRPSPKNYVETDMFGTIKELPIGDDGKILKAMEATSEDGMLTVTIPWGVVALDEDGNPPSTLTVEVDVTPPPLPEGGAIIGLAYDFEPAGVTFEPSITFTWSYDPDILPAGIAEEDLTLAYYDDDAGEWLELLSTVDTITHTITASVSHFTSFAIITRAPAVLPTAPAAFALSNLSIQPAEVQPEESVTITVSVVNTGGMEGSYTVVLNIKGVKEAEKSITLAGGNYRSVSFDVSREDAGSYSVVVDGLSGSFTVVAPPPAAPAPPPVAITRPLINWPLVGGITAAAVILGLFRSFWRRRIASLLAYRALPKFRSFAAILAAGGLKLALLCRRITSLLAHRVRPKFRSFAAILAAGGSNLALLSRRITSLLACRVLPKFRSFAAIMVAGGSNLALLSRRIASYIIRRIKR